MSTIHYCEHKASDHYEGKLKMAGEGDFNAKTYLYYFMLYMLNDLGMDDEYVNVSSRGKMSKREQR